MGFEKENLGGFCVWLLHIDGKAKATNSTNCPKTQSDLTESTDCLVGPAWKPPIGFGQEVFFQAFVQLREKKFDKPCYENGKM